jgi:hypothetical protein
VYKDFQHYLYKWCDLVGACLSCFTLPMAPLHVARISAAIWKWFCRCPDAIGPEHDISSDEEFYTPPTSPPRVADDHPTANVPASAADSMLQKLHVPSPLSPAQSARLRRRHAQAVRQLITPPPAVTPTPHGPLLAYQRPVKVYRPSWAP